MAEVKIFDEYSRADKMRIHLLILLGYTEAKSTISSWQEKGIIPDEEAITGYIYAAIQKHLSTQSQRWFTKYTVYNESPIPSDSPKGKERKEFDLFIEFVYAKGRPRFVFEAKTLNYGKRHQRTGNYTNIDGLQRFIRGEYANDTAKYPEAGMLGYVLSDTEEIWQNRLKTAIDEKKEELRLLVPQRNIQIIDRFPYEWVSKHGRESADSPILIYHILLNCRDTTNNYGSGGRDRGETERHI